MSRRAPFLFRDYIPTPPPVDREKIDAFVLQYEEKRVAEYGAGDVDAASYAEGKREALEGVLADLLNVPAADLDAYWGRTARPDPAPHDLPSAFDVLIAYDQVEAWSGKRLTAEQWSDLDIAIANSSIPEAIATLVENLPSE